MLVPGWKGAGGNTRLKAVLRTAVCADRSNQGRRSKLSGWRTACRPPFDSGWRANPGKKAAHVTA
jgi:hypothetical protein